jgi:uncharacterized SAM-binding protein YcdF (DUF218 family)
VKRPVGQRYAVKQGVPPKKHSHREQRTLDAESMQHVATLMDAEPSRDVILVSDPFHMLRLSVLARRFGLTPYTSPTRTSPISRSRKEEWSYLLAESVKVPVAFLLERRDE